MLTNDTPRIFRWAPSSRAIVGVLSSDGKDNLWEWPMDGSARRQLTQFADDRIFHFDIAPDRRLLLARGKSMADVVLMRRQ